jgi:hypothetical protein
MRQPLRCIKSERKFPTFPARRGTTSPAATIRRRRRFAGSRVVRLPTLMGHYGEALAAAGTENAAPNRRSAGRSSEDAKRCAVDATRCDEGDELSTAKLTQKPGKSAAFRETVKSGTMLCYPFAPLAQLAEQLTLNQ